MDDICFCLARECRLRDCSYLQARKRGIDCNQLLRPSMLAFVGFHRRPALRSFTYAYFRNVLIGMSSDSSPCGRKCFSRNGRILKTKDAIMKTRTHAADYYRRILSAQPHALKRLDAFAAIMHCH